MMDRDMFFQTVGHKILSLSLSYFFLCLQEPDEKDTSNGKRFIQELLPVTVVYV